MWAAGFGSKGILPHKSNPGPLKFKPSALNQSTKYVHSCLDIATLIKMSTINNHRWK